MITFDYLTHTNGFLTKNDVQDYFDTTSDIIKKLESKSHNMTDWWDISTTISKQEVNDIIALSKTIKQNAEVLVVIGIGGSQMGSNAIIQALSPYFKNTSKTKVVFAGTDLSSEYLIQLADYLQDKEYYINVVSKSGNTLEVNLAFEFLYNLTKEKYKTNYKNRIIITTDKTNGPLRKLCQQENFTNFVIPANIGGRFSVLSTAGLLSIAVAGMDVNKLLNGANRAKKHIPHAVNYAISRHIMLKHNRAVEGLTYYEQKLNGFALWAQQLLGESLGKNQSGVLPIINQNTKNLHSIGQFIQQGSKIMFETVIKVKQGADLIINNKSLKHINDIAISAVASAHENGNVPSLIITLNKLNEEGIGELIYFFYVATAVCGYLQNINPFDQPGVEEYKRLIKEEMNKQNL